MIGEYQIIEILKSKMDTNKQQAQPVWPPHSQQTYANPGVNSLPQINAPTSSSPFSPAPSHSPDTFVQVTHPNFRTLTESPRSTVQNFQMRQYPNERFRVSQPQILEHIAFQPSPRPYPPPASDGYSTPEPRTVAQVSTVTFQPLQQVSIQNYERISPVEDFQEPVPTSDENLAQFEPLQPDRTQSLIVTQSIDRNMQASPNSTIVTGSLFQLGNQIIAHAIVPAEIAMRSPLTQRVLSPERTIVAIRRDPRESPQDPPLVQQSVLFTQAQSSQRFSPVRPFTMSTALQLRPLLASASQLMSSQGGRIQAQVLTIEESSSNLKVSQVAESSDAYIPGAADSTHDDGSGLEPSSNSTRLTQVDSSSWEPSHALHDLSSTTDITAESMAHSTMDSVDIIANGDHLTLTSTSMNDGMDTTVDTTMNGVETWATILDEAGRPLGSLRPLRKSMRIASMEQEIMINRPKYISKIYNPRELCRWCEECNTTYENECPKHRLQVLYDRPVLPRAWASLPPQLSIHIIYQSQDQRETLYGVFTKKLIPKRTQFGPFQAELVKLKEHLKSQHFILQIEEENGEISFLDISNDNECNWMKLVRPADSFIEQNMVVYQHGNELFYVTIKNIEPKTELRVWYAAPYAERIGTTIHELRQEDIMALEDQQNVWPCFECNKRFNSSAKLQKHLNTHDEHLNRTEDPVRRAKKKASFFRRPKGRPPRKYKGMKQEEYVCEICRKVFPRNYSLQRHLIMHSGEKKYKCPICDMKFSHVYNRNRHLRRHKARGETEPMTRPFKSLFKKKGKESGGNEWVCTHCDLTFDNSSLLNLHTLTHAAENVGLEEIVRFSTKDGDIDREVLGQDLSQDCETSEDGTNLQCPECTQIFDTRGMLIQHASVHGKVAKRSPSKNPGKPYKCDLCYKAFSTEERLQKHMLVHGSEESKPLQCDVCLKRFLNNSALSCHIKIHSDKKYYECPFCKEGFDQIQNLKDHVVIHAVDGTYLCPYCQKVFDEYNAVRKHIRAFHSEKRYPCDKCDKVFPRPDKLKLHMLRHSNHREFLCANCGKQFKRKDKLKEHMKRMHSAEREAKLALKTPKATSSKKFIPKVSPTDYHRFIYKCHTCLLGFKRRGMLVNHLAKRHPDVRPESVPELNLPILKTTRDYYCQYCEKVYKSSSKRKAHILKNHPGADLPLSNRRKGGIPEVPGIPNPTFSETVGSITTHPHPCGFCHKQYASKAKLLQHQRKKHIELLPASLGTITQVQTSDGEVEITIKRKCSTPRPRSRYEEDATTEVTVVTTTTPQPNESLQAADLLTQAMSELTQSLSEYRPQTGEFQTISPRIAHTGTTTMLPLAVTTQHPHSTIELSHLAPALTHYQTTQQVQITTQPLSPQSAATSTSTTYVPRTWASYTNYSTR